MLTFKITKSGTNTYKVTPTGTFAVDFTVNVSSFDEYIGGKPPSQFLIRHNTQEFYITVPTDNIYLVVITEGTDESTNVLYNFDTLRLVMKSLLKKILCPEHHHDCPIEATIRKELDRLFITRVTTSLAVLLGMIHSEQVDHYHYFSFDESRLAALQRVNDILKRTLLMYSEYTDELPCNCHKS